MASLADNSSLAIILVSRDGHHYNFRADELVKHTDTWLYTLVTAQMHTAGNTPLQLKYTHAVLESLINYLTDPREAFEPKTDAEAAAFNNYLSRPGKLFAATAPPVTASLVAAPNNPSIPSGAAPVTFRSTANPQCNLRRGTIITSLCTAPGAQLKIYRSNSTRHELFLTIARDTVAFVNNELHGYMTEAYIAYLNQQLKSHSLIIESTFGLLTLLGYHNDAN